MTYADRLGSVAKIERQRKPRVLDKDHRERDEVTVTLLRGEGFTINERPLLVGDWAWDIREQAYLFTHLGCQRFVVERKTLADLRDVPRLKKQLANARSVMHQEQVGDQTFFVVLVEYKFDSDFKRKWSDKSIRSAKLSIQVGGIRVTECQENGMQEAISGLYEWSQKTRHELGG